MVTRRQPTPGPQRPRTSPHETRVRHAVGEAAQRPLDDASAGQPDGGDWMAEHMAPAQTPAPKTKTKPW
jgi:hypothetical protein